MRPSFRALSVLAAIGAIVFFCSCDKHRVGEWPEIQKEHVDLGHEAKAEQGKGEQTRADSAEATPTPAEFFPEKKSP